MGTTTKAADDWWLNFDVKMTSLPTYNETKTSNDHRRSFITFMPKSGAYYQFLNVHYIPDETEKTYVTLYGAVSGGWKLYLVKGQEYSFHINLDPATGCYKVYAHLKKMRLRRAISGARRRRDSR